MLLREQSDATERADMLRSRQFSRQQDLCRNKGMRVTPWVRDNDGNSRLDGHSSDLVVWGGRHLDLSLARRGHACRPWKTITALLARRLSASPYNSFGEQITNVTTTCLLRRGCRTSVHGHVPLSMSRSPPRRASPALGHRQESGWRGNTNNSSVSYASAGSAALFWLHGPAPSLPSRGFWRSWHSSGAKNLTYCSAGQNFGLARIQTSGQSLFCETPGRRSPALSPTKRMRPCFMTGAAENTVTVDVKHEGRSLTTINTMFVAMVTFSWRIRHQS